MLKRLVITDSYQVKVLEYEDAPLGSEQGQEVYTLMKEDPDKLLKFGVQF
jgi:hypothetical protein